MQTVTATVVPTATAVAAATVVPTATVALDDILKIMQNPAVVALITALVTLWAKSWFDRRQEREKVRATHTYPKAFEALSNLNSALVDVFQAFSPFSPFDAITLERTLSVEKVRNLNTKMEVFSKARLLAEVYLGTTKARYRLLVVQYTFVTAASIVFSMHVQQQMAEELLDEEDKKYLEMWTRKKDEFNWGDISKNYDAAIAALAPLLRP